MPALWQSSQRPMYIRTVWIDGFRHAILSHDDPHYIELNSKKRRPHSSASVNPKRKAQSSRLSHHGDLNCSGNLELIIRSDKIKIPQETNIETINLTEVGEDEIVSAASPIPLCESDNTETQLISIDMRVVKSNRTARTDVKENSDLSDRVLQWLDLAGKVDLLATENAERISQPRHSCPEIQRRNMSKPQTVTNVKERESKQPANESKTGDAIDRVEPYVPTTATTVENYARQSRHVNSTARDSHARIKENKRVKDTRHVIGTRQKMVSERCAMEKQYAEPVNKNIVPDLGKAKKQVHIFMPESIPKTTVTKTGNLLSNKNKN